MDTCLFLFWLQHQADFFVLEEIKRGFAEGRPNFCDIFRSSLVDSTTSEVRLTLGLISHSG